MVFWVTEYSGTIQGKRPSWGDFGDAAATKILLVDV